MVKPTGYEEVEQEQRASSSLFRELQFIGKQWGSSRKIASKLAMPIGPIW